MERKIQPNDTQHIGIVVMLSVTNKPFMLSITNKHFMLSVTYKPFLLSVINEPFMLSVTNKPFKLRVIGLNVVMMSVVATIIQSFKTKLGHHFLTKRKRKKSLNEQY